MAKMFIPPNGLAGFAQQTPAVQSGYMKRSSGPTRRRKRSKKKVVRAARRTRSNGASRAAKRTRTNGGRLKKGSAAAKARMAKLRRMRK